jgi:hypothetical protein
MPRLYHSVSSALVRRPDRRLEATDPRLSPASAASDRASARISRRKSAQGRARKPRGDGEIEIRMARNRGNWHPHAGGASGRARQDTGSAGMSADTCSRVRDALAVGQVWGDASLLEHAKDCEVCTSALAALKKRRDFRDAFPVLSSIADQSERSPTRARTDADEARLRASRRRLYLMIAAVVAMAGFFARPGVFDASSKPREGEEISAMKAPTFRISNIENALFESKVEGGTVRSTLTRGVAAFYVERLGPDQRFLLTLPDGDLEVRGTRFVVSIEGGKTHSIEVSEGAVALRMQGRAEVLLGEGERWPAVGSGRPTLTFLHMAPRKDAGPPESAKPND